MFCLATSNCNNQKSQKISVLSSYKQHICMLFSLEKIIVITKSFILMHPAMLVTLYSMDCELYVFLLTKYSISGFLFNQVTL